MHNSSTMLLGLDIGTSGIKAALFNLQGRELYRAYRAYKPDCDSNDYLSLSVYKVRQSAGECFGEICAKFDSSKIQALAISTQGEAVVPVDADMHPLADAIVSFDSRNEAECQEFCQHFKRHDVYSRTGMPAHSMFTATKLLWIARNQPEIINKTRYFVNFDSFIALQLGISPYMVNSLASRTMLYDIVKHSWVQEYCDFCQIDTTKMPPVVASGTYLGTTTEKAQSLNLPAGIKVIAGNHDQLCCSLGAGIVYPGSAMSSMGTTESMVTISPTLNLRNDLYQSSIPVYDYVIPGQYAYMTFLTSCASLLSWFKDDVLQTSGNFFQRFESEANSRQHLTKVLFLPYLLGSGTPSLNSKARGVFEGITIGHNAVDFYMAILQSISCEEKLNCENMEKSGIHIDQIRCIGGGAQSDLWLQLKAIFTNKEIVSLNSRETGCLGAALIAGVGSGIFADFKEACDNCISIKRIFAPLKQYQAEVDEYYAKYLKLRQNILKSAKPTTR